MRLLALLAATLLSCACPAHEAKPEPPAKPSPKPKPESRRLQFGGDRPVRLRLPRGHAPERPGGLVVLLHGFGASGGEGLIRALHFDALADRESLLVVAPDGTVDRRGARFWNATDACCDVFGAKPDDVAYLSGLIREISAAYAVAPRRVYLVGVSNGGFMAHRMACERADLVGGIASIAGAGYAKASRCRPSRPVRVLELHGDRDTVIAYGGGQLPLDNLPRDRWMKKHPGAKATVAAWARRDRCRGEAITDKTRVDLAADVPGRETQKMRYQGCAAGSAVALWTLVGGPHVPRLNAAATEQIWAFVAGEPGR